MIRLLACIAVFAGAGLARADEPVSPKELTPLFNGKNLDGLTTWLKRTQSTTTPSVCSA